MDRALDCVVFHAGFHMDIPQLILATRELFHRNRKILTAYKLYLSGLDVDRVIATGNVIVVKYYIYLKQKCLDAVSGVVALRLTVI